jgi:hypothetical protein
MKNIYFLPIFLLGCASASNDLEPAVKVTVGDSAVNKVLAKTLPYVQTTINNFLHNMDTITCKVLTTELTVGPFDDCNIYNLSDANTEFSTSAGLEITAPFDIDCEAPYKLTELKVPIAWGTMILKAKDGAHIYDESSLKSDGQHIIIGNEKVDVHFVPLIRFTGLVGSIVSVAIAVFEPLITFAVDTAMQLGIKAVIGTFNDILMEIPLQISVGNIVNFDIALPYVNIADSTLTLGMDGTFQRAGEAFEDKSNPFETKVLEDVNSTEAGDGQFVVADYSPLTFLYALQVGGKLDFIIPYDLTTTELAAIAPAMSRTYPKTPVQVRLYIGNITDEAFQTSKDIALLQLPLYMEFDPVVNNETVPGFTIKSTLQAGLTLSIVPNDKENATSTQKFIGKLTTLDFADESVVETNVGNINDKLLITTLNGVFEAVEVTINKFLEDGVPLPRMFIDTSIYFGESETQGASDFDFDVFGQELLSLSTYDFEGNY